MNVQTQGRLRSEQFGNIVLRANADGSTLRQRRGAGGTGRHERRQLQPPQRPFGRDDRSVPGSNAIATAAAVNATLDKVRPRFPEGLKARATYDTTVFVNDTIHEVLKTLFEAFVLVALVVFLFLGHTIVRSLRFR